MNKSNWKDTAELIGIAAIVASLVFVGLELQQGQRIAQADRQHQQIEREFLLTNLITEHVDLIAKLNNGDDIDDKELILADRLVLSIWSAYFFTASQRSLLDAPGGDAAIRTLATFFNDNPGLKSHYQAQIARIERDTESVRGYGFTGFGREFHDKLAESLRALETSGQ